jgi:hypothetical protein
MAAANRSAWPHNSIRSASSHWRPARLPRSPSACAWNWAAVRAALRSLGAEAQVRSTEQAGVWVVATIKLADPEFRARKEATYKQLRLNFEPLEGLPAEQPSFVLGRHASQAEAEAQLAAFDKRGLKGLRVLPLQSAQRRHTLVLAQVDGLMAGKLKASKDAALAGGFHACQAGGTASAASR